MTGRRGAGAGDAAAPPAAVVQRLVDVVLGSDRGLGIDRGTGERTRLVCLDGVAGAGKTTLAAALEVWLSGAGRSVTVVHMDDLYEGWSGLLSAHTSVTALVDALDHGEPAVFERYDWESGERRERVVVPAVDVVVVEGCGSAPPSVAERASLVVFVTAPDTVRLARGLVRDGEALREHWRAFMSDEAVLAARDATEQRADVVLDQHGSPLRWRVP